MTDLTTGAPPSSPAPPTADTASRRPPGDAFPTLRQRMTAAWDRLVVVFGDDPGRVAEAVCSLVVVVLGTALVLATLHPSDMWADTTPTGGDMGAHVWGPRYLLDHLLPQGRLSGWTPDWYDGFPAYQFYMVVPSLMIVALHVGLPVYLAVPAVLALVGVAVLGWARERLYPYRYLIASAAALAIVLSVPMPYNRSFKLVTAIGLLGVPVACWALAKLADLPFPIPPLMSAAGLLFIYNREPLFNNTGNIIGGNFPSTMAGEFAFSISLTVSLVYLGVASRGLRTGRHRALAAALFALAGLCHLIPAFFVLGCTAALFLLHPDRARLKWLATMVPVAGLLTAFWVIPFWWRSDYVNHMGWEKLPTPRANVGEEALKLAGDESSAWYYLLPQGLRWLMVAAVVGIVVSIIRRYTVGMVLGAAWAGVMVAFVVLPDGRLWNARLLPFMYLSVALLAAIGLGELIRVAGSIAAGRADRSYRPVSVTVALLAALGVIIYVALPLQGILDTPVGGIRLVERAQVSVTGADGNQVAQMQSRPAILGGLGGLFDTTAQNPVAGWSAWNYSGLEAKKLQQTCTGEGAARKCTVIGGGWPEYRDLMATMARLGEDPKAGCGRAFWEYAGERLNTYGTPMAPMLLPYWTDGCIGSQEGLYFESSTTVPIHFLMQSELSTTPSSPQRELPYPGFDIDAGVRHLQLLGVKYYLAVSPQAVEAAAAHADLTEVAVSGPWHVYQVADAPLVEGLEYEPVVARGIGRSQDDWLPAAAAWFLDPDRNDVPLAIDGPSSWDRVDVEPVPTEWRRLVLWARQQIGATGPMDQLPAQPRTKLPPVKVTNIEQGEDALSFDVSKVGVPVLVKVSYFPNWQVSGAEGPYRVTPNLMVVIPTSEHVSMTFGRTPPDLLGAGMTVLGLVGLVWLSRRKPIEVEPLAPTRVARWIDGVVTLRERPNPAVDVAGDDPPGGWPDGWQAPPVVAGGPSEPPAVLAPDDDLGPTRDGPVEAGSPDPTGPEGR